MGKPGRPPRFGMHYIHVNGNIQTTFRKIWVDGTSDGAFGSYSVSHIIIDSGCTQWTGRHAHDFALLGPPPNGLPGYNRRLPPDVPTGDYCPPAPCKTFWNWEWMRYFEWGEGSQQ